MTTSNFDVIGRRRIWLVVSGALVLLSVVGLAARGLDLAIDFVGGTSFVLDDIQADDLDAQDLRDAATAAGASDVTAQLRQDPVDGSVGALVEMETLEVGGETQAAVEQALIEVAGIEAGDVQFETVGPSWGERISRKALEALVVFVVVVLLYITWRLEFKMAGAAIVALVHDLLITVGAYALLGFKVSPSTIIALLTILGYSLYDTVVVFDRIRDNTVSLGSIGHRTYSQSVNTSLNEVLWRSINTSLTSLLPVGSLLFVGSRLLGADTLEDLALALFVGMFLGTYSSIFVAGPFLAWWKERDPDMQRLAEKARERADTDEAPVKPAGPEATAAKAPITTEYVRGRGKRKRGR